MAQATPYTVLVIPSIRQTQLTEFFEAWGGRGGWDTVVVVEDNETKSFHLGDKAQHHFSHKEIVEDLGDDSWIISRKDSAIRSFGFIKAYELGADRIITLDDDVRPHRGGYNSTLAAAFEESLVHPVWVESVPGRRTRGLPYINRGAVGNVVAGFGFWANVCDDDAPCTLVNRPGYFEPPQGARLIPHGQLTPICGMSLYFRREFTPLAYFPLMGEGQPYRRMDDIWFGITAKHIADHLGWYVSAGGPVIEHVRASDPFKNLVAEAPGIAANEKYWEIVRAVKLTKTSATACVQELGEALQDHDDAYVRKWGRALVVWGAKFGDNS